MGKEDGGEITEVSKADNSEKVAAESIVNEVTERKKQKDEEITRHVLCCSSDHTSRDPNKRGVQTKLSKSKVAQEYEAAESLNPKWYDRLSSPGWKGTTYAEAVAFCQAVDDATQTLCPYEAYCPTGPHRIPFGGTKKEDSSRAPIANHKNRWVQIGAKNMCKQYTIFSNAIGSPEEKD